ncbi:MAG: hypothetical protein HY725_14495 [Candidatus Rokubacteria bacterium]|nr:hypothetical protein [Candidatus Rokubacteria bacterium]
MITYYLKSVEGAWKFLLAIGAGTGLVYLLRWYWWRINAWSEVAAMTGAFALSLWLQFGVGLNVDDPRGFAWLMLLTVAGTTAVWLAVTFLTPAEPLEHLQRFCGRVKPGGAGWRRVTGSGPSNGGAGVRGLVQWALGCVVVYLGLFGIGSVVLGQPLRGVVFLLVAALLTGWILRDSGEAVVP